MGVMTPCSSLWRRKATIVTVTVSTLTALLLTLVLVLASEHQLVQVAMAGFQNLMLASTWREATAATMEAAALKYRPFLRTSELGGADRGVVEQGLHVVIILAIVLTLLIQLWCRRARAQKAEPAESSDCAEAPSPASCTSYTAPSSNTDSLHSPSSTRMLLDVSGEESHISQPVTKAATEHKDTPPDALTLVNRFMEMSKVPPDAAADASKLVLKSVQLLQSCGFGVDEIAAVMGHTSIYFIDISERCAAMGNSEVGNIVTLLMYMAHSYVLDENCPLRVWHQHLFVGYCDLPTLNKALMCLMKMRKFILRVDQQEAWSRYESLSAGC